MGRPDVPGGPSFLFITNVRLRNLGSLENLGGLRKLGVLGNLTPSAGWSAQNEVVGIVYWGGEQMYTEQSYTTTVEGQFNS